MNLSRRGFFKATGAALATTMAFELSSRTQAFASESKEDWKLVNTEEYTNICCYCAGGCGSICFRRATASSSTWKATRTIPSTMAACARRAPPMCRPSQRRRPRRIARRPASSGPRARIRWFAVPGSNDLGATFTWDRGRSLKSPAHGQGHSRRHLRREGEDGLTVNRCDGIASLGGRPA